jgi:N-acetylmuramoyl-L-alanine amidase
MGLGAFSLALTPEALAQAQARVTKSPVQRRTIVIDAGHGGIDPGCIGYSGTYEKYIAFDTAQEIARLLEATGRFRPVLTRSRDEFIALQQRVVLARAANADLFLSIHADSIPDHSLRGASVFTLSEKASDAAAAALAAKENHSDVIGGVSMAGQTPEVSSILLDLARRQTNNQSIVAASGGDVRGGVGSKSVRFRSRSRSMRLPLFALVAVGFAATIGSAQAFTQDSVTNKLPDGGARFQDSDVSQKWGGNLTVNGKSASAQATDADDGPSHTYANVEKRAFNKTGYFEPIILLPAKQ